MSCLTTLSFRPSIKLCRHLGSISASGTQPAASSSQIAGTTTSANIQSSHEQGSALNTEQTVPSVYASESDAVTTVASKALGFYEVTMIRSPIKLPNGQARFWLAKLGLTKRWQTWRVPHTKDNAGLILKVKELVRVKNVYGEHLTPGPVDTFKPAPGFEVIGKSSDWSEISEAAPTPDRPWMAPFRTEAVLLPAQKAWLFRQRRRETRQKDPSLLETLYERPEHRKQVGKLRQSILSRRSGHAKHRLIG